MDAHDAPTSPTLDVAFRYPWHAAVVFAVIAGGASGFALLLPMWILMDQLGPFWDQSQTIRGTGAWWTSFVFMVALATAIGSGVIAFALWRLILVPGGRFSFLPGALVGLLVGVAVTMLFVFALEQRIAESWGVQTAADPPKVEFLLALGLGLSVPAGLLGALAGGLLAAAQGRVRREEEAEMLRGVGAPG